MTRNKRPALVIHAVAEVSDRIGAIQQPNDHHTSRVLTVESKGYGVVTRLSSGQASASVSPPMSSVSPMEEWQKQL